MADRPILFSAPMVRALLAGTKTQTRRVSAKQDWTEAIVRSHPRQKAGVPYAVGDRLWVREAWRIEGAGSRVSAEACRGKRAVEYRADGYDPIRHDERSPLFMPRWASRLTLAVSDVRVQRLQEIREADCLAEGAEQAFQRSMVDGGIMVESGTPGITYSPRAWYRKLWDSLNAERGFAWDTNPWVVAVSFTVQHGNIDAAGVR